MAITVLFAGFLCLIVAVWLLRAWLQYTVKMEAREDELYRKNAELGDAFDADRQRIGALEEKLYGLRRKVQEQRKQIIGLERVRCAGAAYRSETYRRLCKWMTFNARLREALPPGVYANAAAIAREGAPIDE